MHDSESSQGGQAGVTEISYQMIEAGVRVYTKWQNDNWERSAVNANANLVCKVFQAMEAERHTPQSED